MNQRFLFGDEQLNAPDKAEARRRETARRKAIGLRLKEEGMTLAAEKNPSLLKEARELAARIAKQNDGYCHADLLRYAMEDLGMDELGASAGSVFKGSQWEMMPGRIVSSHPKNHGREIKVWLYRGK